ncbi:hypothetical protein TNCV_476521 [Trichonephila clavipes]|nr:hypothetical protein TNCV_476521 [Trichonephila clavipes]
MHQHNRRLRGHWSKKEKLPEKIVLCKLRRYSRRGRKSKKELSKTVSGLTIEAQWLSAGGGMPKGAELTREGFRATNRSLGKQPLPRPDFIEKVYIL